MQVHALLIGESESAAEKFQFFIGHLDVSILNPDEPPILRIGHGDLVFQILFSLEIENLVH